MAGTPYQIKQLSTPKVLIDGVVIAVKPNSVTVRIPGDMKVRAMSLGGGATQAVAGLNAESLIGHVKLEIAATGQNADRVRAWKQKMIAGQGLTVQLVEDGVQFPHQNMFLTKDTDVHMSADGNIPIEFEGDYTP
jgi:hypothetical protein